MDGRKEEGGREGLKTLQLMADYQFWQVRGRRRGGQRVDVTGQKGEGRVEIKRGGQLAEEEEVGEDKKEDGEKEEVVGV